jgi:hypothetical protein
MRFNPIVNQPSIFATMPLMEKIDEQGGEYSHGAQKAKISIQRMKNKTVGNMEERITERLSKINLNGTGGS